jgi:hypothetical protein
MPARATHGGGGGGAGGKGAGVGGEAAESGTKEKVDKMQRLIVNNHSKICMLYIYQPCMRTHACTEGEGVQDGTSDRKAQGDAGKTG